jgi:hypothetical protein
MTSHAAYARPRDPKRVSPAVRTRAIGDSVAVEALRCEKCAQVSKAGCLQRRWSLAERGRRMQTRPIPLSLGLPGGRMQYGLSPSRVTFESGMRSSLRASLVLCGPHMSRFVSCIRNRLPAAQVTTIDVHSVAWLAAECLPNLQNLLGSVPPRRRNGLSGFASIHGNTFLSDPNPNKVQSLWGMIHLRE